jgi:hypothetical protein
VEAYRIDRFGSVDGVVLRSSEDPRPGLREVMMRVRASLLNYRDLRTGLWAERSAISAKGDRAYPILPCSDLTRNAPGARTSPRCGRPLRAGSAADVQRRHPPVGGEVAEDLEMASRLIYKRVLKVIFKLSAEHARTSRKLSFSDLHGHFHGNLGQPDR